MTATLTFGWNEVWEGGARLLAKADAAYEKVQAFVRQHQSLILLLLLIKFVIGLLMAKALLG